MKDVAFTRFARALSLGAVLIAAAPAAAEKDRAAADRPDYHLLVLEKDGQASRAALDALSTEVRRELHGRDGQVVVMVHGFGQDQQDASDAYADIARRFRKQAEASGLKLALVGVHWPADPGAMRKWLPQATAHRLATLVGFKRAVKNPYLEKAKEASRAGRTGLRSVFFRIQDDFPTAPLHVVAHSMGCEVLMNALNPHADDGKLPATAVEQPERPLRLGVVTLAGADLDHDTFSRESRCANYKALAAARVWWITVPEKGKADGMLELRNAIRNRRAVGNAGVQLDPDDLGALVAARSLVVDTGNIPATHGFTDYYNEPRVKELAASFLYLQQPEAEAGRASILASLDRVLQCDTPSLASYAKDPNCTARLYASWRMSGNCADAVGVALTRTRTLVANGGGVPESRVAGARETRSDQ